MTLKWFCAGSRLCFQTKSTLGICVTWPFSKRTHWLTQWSKNFKIWSHKNMPSPYESEISLKLEQSDFFYSQSFWLTVCVAPIFMFNICISRFNTFSKSTVKAAKGLRKATLYISSTINSEIMLWHNHLDVYASKSCSWHCQTAKLLQADALSAKTKLLYYFIPKCLQYMVVITLTGACMQ